MLETEVPVKILLQCSRQEKLSPGTKIMAVEIKRKI